MAITYPLDLPTSPGIARISFRARSVVGRARSPYSLRRQKYVWSGQLWEADISLPTMNRAQAETWLAFLLKLNGGEGTFLLGDPDGAQPRGAGGGSPLVNGGGQTGRTLVTDGWPSSTLVLRAGDYIQLGDAGTSRLYKVLNNATTNGSGQVTLDIWPALRTSPANNDALVIEEARGLFELAGGGAEWSADELSRYGVSFGAVEAW